MFEELLENDLDALSDTSDNDDDCFVFDLPNQPFSTINNINRNNNDPNSLAPDDVIHADTGEPLNDFEHEMKELLCATDNRVLALSKPNDFDIQEEFDTGRIRSRRNKNQFVINVNDAHQNVMQHHTESASYALNIMQAIQPASPTVNELEIQCEVKELLADMLFSIEQISTITASVAGVETSCAAQGESDMEADSATDQISKSFAYLLPSISESIAVSSDPKSTLYEITDDGVPESALLTNAHGDPNENIEIVADVGFDTQHAEANMADYSKRQTEAEKAIAEQMRLDIQRMQEEIEADLKRREERKKRLTEEIYKQRRIRAAIKIQCAVRVISAQKVYKWKKMNNARRVREELEELKDKLAVEIRNEVCGLTLSLDGYAGEPGCGIPSSTTDVVGLECEFIAQEVFDIMLEQQKLEESERKRIEELELLERLLREEQAREIQELKSMRISEEEMKELDRMERQLQLDRWTKYEWPHMTEEDSCCGKTALRCHLTCTIAMETLRNKEKLEKQQRAQIKERQAKIALLFKQGAVGDSDANTSHAKVKSKTGFSGWGGQVKINNSMSGDEDVQASETAVHSIQSNWSSIIQQQLVTNQEVLNGLSKCNVNASMHPPELMLNAPSSVALNGISSNVSSDCFPREKFSLRSLPDACHVVLYMGWLEWSRLWLEEADKNEKTSKFNELYMRLRSPSEQREQQQIDPGHRSRFSVRQSMLSAIKISNLKMEVVSANDSEPVPTSLVINAAACNKANAAEYMEHMEYKSQDKTGKPKHDATRLINLESIFVLEELVCNHMKLMDIESLFRIHMIQSHANPGQYLKVLNLDNNCLNNENWDIHIVKYGNENGALFPMLEKLSLDHNEFTSIPYFGTNFPLLQQLKLYGNKIQCGYCVLNAGEESVNDGNCDENNYVNGFEHLNSLTTLDLGRNKLDYFDGSLLSCNPLLSSLILSGNMLNAVPYPLYLPLLKELKLSDNKLTHLDNWQCSCSDDGVIKPCLFLPSLEAIYLQDNNIERIAATSLMGCSLVLLFIDLSFNSVSDLQNVEGLLSCQHLQTLHLHDNPVFDPYMRKDTIQCLIDCMPCLSSWVSSSDDASVKTTGGGIRVVGTENRVDDDKTRKPRLFLSSLVNFVDSVSRFGGECGSFFAPVIATTGGKNCSGVAIRDDLYNQLSSGLSVPVATPAASLVAETVIAENTNANHVVASSSVRILNSFDDENFHPFLSPNHHEDQILSNIRRCWSKTGSSEILVKSLQLAQAVIGLSAEINNVKTYERNRSRKSRKDGAQSAETLFIGLVCSLLSMSKLLDECDLFCGQGFAVDSVCDSIHNKVSRFLDVDDEKYWLPPTVVNAEKGEKSGSVGTDAIAAVVKFQAMVRGYCIRKKLRLLLGTVSYIDEELDDILANPNTQIRKKTHNNGSAIGEVDVDFNNLDDMLAGILGVDEPSELQDGWLAYNPDSGPPKAMAYGDHIRQRRTLSANRTVRSAGNLAYVGVQTPDRRMLLSHPPDLSPGVELGDADAPVRLQAWGYDGQSHDQSNGNAFDEHEFSDELSDRPISALTDDAQSRAVSEQGWGETVNDKRRVPLIQGTDTSLETSKSPGVSTSRSNRSTATSSSEVAQEWGITNPHVLATIMKRNLRMSKQAHMKEEREKEKDPQYRFEKFRKNANREETKPQQQRGTSTGSFGGKPRTFQGKNQGRKTKAIAVNVPAWMNPGNEED